MKDTETFIIHLRSDVTGVFTININIPESRNYKHFKMFVKDLVIIDEAPPTNIKSPDCFTFNSDTLLFINNYDNFNGYGFPAPSLQSGSKVLSVINGNNPYMSNNFDTYFNIPSINGTHRFWIENFFSNSLVNDTYFYACLVVQGYN